MGQELKSKIALVTGASRGIGEAIARRFAAEGATVVITARTVEPGTGKFGENAASEAQPKKIDGSLKEVAARITADGGKAIPIQCDMADPASRAKAVEQAIAAVGRIDILVNNAAAGGYGQSWDKISSKHYDRLWQTNVKGPFDLMQRLAPAMIARGQGWIVNIGSKTAELPVRPFNPFEKGSGVMLYGTTKAALNRLTAGVAAELDGSGVCVNEFGPFSIVWTPGTAMVGVEKYRGLPGWVEEPVEGMAETALALATCDPNAVNGLTVYSTTYLNEIGREIRTLDGKEPLRNWKPAVA
ncbi:MAG: family NAD(P)-dependent oxidoreductase [Rhodospirillales bacterium]|nr:family NAD(P)-dependent oxidoreductase [Rhodospirillales bacterium]